MANKKPYDLDEAREMGILYQSQGSKNHSSALEMKSYVVVARDGKSWTHFNLYGGSLGKRGIKPAMKQISNNGLYGNLEAIHDYLTNKNYCKA